MKNGGQLKIIVGIVLLLFVNIVFSLPLSAKEDPLNMGVFPRRSAQVTIKNFTPLAEYLTKKLNRKVKLVTTYDFASFWQGVKENKYDIVHYNQYHYVRSHKEHGYNVIAMNEEFGESKLSSVIISKKDSELFDIEDIRGKTFAFGGGPKAMVSYILPIYTLRNAGISSYQFESIFTKNPPNAIMAVYFDKAEFAGIGNKVLEMSVIKNNIDVSEIISIAQSESIAHLPWAVKKSMPLDLSLKIQDLFVNLKDNPQTKTILDSAKVTNFVLAEDSDYDRTREIVLNVIGTQY